MLKYLHLLVAYPPLGCLCIALQHRASHNAQALFQPCQCTALPWVRVLSRRAQDLNLAGAHFLHATLLLIDFCLPCRCGGSFCASDQDPTPNAACQQCRHLVTTVERNSRCRLPAAVPQHLPMCVRSGSDRDHHAVLVNAKVFALLLPHHQSGWPSAGGSDSGSGMRS